MSHKKIDLANQYRDREFFLFDSGSKQTTESIMDDSRVSNADQLPIEYYQSNYGTDLNGCVWLSVCQLLYDIDRVVSQSLLEEYKQDPFKFEYITIFDCNRGMSLHSLLKNTGCRFQVEHVKPGQGVDLTNHILEKRTAGFFIALLEDTSGGHHHCVGINIFLKKTYDPMESYVLPLSKKSLDIACGANREFRRFKIVAELNEFRTNKFKN